MKERPNVIDMDISEIKSQLSEGMDPKYRRLNEALAGLLEEYSLVNFCELNIEDEESVDTTIAYINNAINFGEDQEPRESDYLGNMRDEEPDQWLYIK